MLLLATMAFGQAKEDAGDGKMLDKQTMEFKDYLPEIHGTIRGKYEYQTETSESRFEVQTIGMRMKYLRFFSFLWKRIVRAGKFRPYFHCPSA